MNKLVNYVGRRMKNVLHTPWRTAAVNKLLINIEKRVARSVSKQRESGLDALHVIGQHCLLSVHSLLRVYTHLIDIFI